jgi:hypothetical protein
MSVIDRGPTCKMRRDAKNKWKIDEETAEIKIFYSTSHEISSASFLEKSWRS